MSDSSKLCPVCTQSWSAADHTNCIYRWLTDAEMDTINFALGLFLGQGPEVRALSAAIANTFEAEIITDEPKIRALAERFRRRAS